MRKDGLGRHMRRIYGSVKLEAKDFKMDHRKSVVDNVVEEIVVDKGIDLESETVRDADVIPSKVSNKTQPQGKQRKTKLYKKESKCDKCPNLHFVDRESHVRHSREVHGRNSAANRQEIERKAKEKVVCDQCGTELGKDKLRQHKLRRHKLKLQLNLTKHNK